MTPEVIVLTSVLLTLSVITGVFIWFRDMRIAPVPSISTRTAILKELLPALDLKDGDVVYDLGCGQGRVVRAIARAYPAVSVTGVERGVLPFLWACLLTRESNARIIYGDLFTAQTNNPTHVYVYLYPEMMRRLSPVLRSLLRKGVRVVSLDFPFPEWVPDRCIDIPCARYELGRRLYVYTV